MRIPLPRLLRTKVATDITKYIIEPFVYPNYKKRFNSVMLELLFYKNRLNPLQDNRNSLFAFLNGGNEISFASEIMHYGRKGLRVYGTTSSNIFSPTYVIAFIRCEKKAHKENMKATLLELNNIISAGKEKAWQAEYQLSGFYFALYSHRYLKRSSEGSKLSSG